MLVSNMNPNDSSLQLLISLRHFFYGITDFNFVGAGVTLVGVSTAVVTINKTLVIGTRSGAQTINVSSGIATIQLRSGVGTVRF